MIKKNDDLLNSALKLKNWCIKYALPTWSAKAQLANGSWIEYLNLNGSPNMKAVRRWRVLARQVYVYAEATSLGWYKGLEIAESTYIKMKNIGLVHKVSISDEVIDDTHDLYDHAFYILAASSLYKLTKNKLYLSDAEKILDWIDVNLGHPNGGWKESNKATLKDMRRQNPHMHMFEAVLSLYDVTGNKKYIKYADSIYSIFKNYIYDNGTISEYFNAEWGLQTGYKGQTKEPGHCMEWVWLLGQYNNNDDTNIEFYQHKLYDATLKNSAKFLNDEESKTGQIRRETKRLWVQTELVKAHLAMSEAGVDGARSMAAKSINSLFSIYLKKNGLWNDQINIKEKNIAKNIPVSTFYHIVCMATEAERIGKKVV
jgi:mannose/cellobiose epimerase-like protein (N-acyl-D-glucosamine 2-epimerase family)